MEKVFCSLKREWLTKRGDVDFGNAIPDINHWTNRYYTVFRPHINKGSVPPCMYEERWKQTIPVF